MRNGCIVFIGDGLGHEDERFSKGY